MTASATQMSKFQQFVDLPAAAELVFCCQLVAEAAELKVDDLGVRWGVTVCVSKTSSLRVNVGNRVLLDARPDGEIELFIVHPSDRPALWDDEVDVYNGFAQVRDSIRLVVSSADALADLLSEPELVAEVKAHAEASGRMLPRPDWHNPLLDDLIGSADYSLLQAGDDDEGYEDDDGIGDPHPDEAPDQTAEPGHGREFEQGAGEEAGPTSAALAPASASAARDPSTVLIAEVSGTGSTKTRPFDIPPHAEFFVIRWNTTDPDADIEVNGVPPHSAYESFHGARGEGAVYESGRFYVALSAEGTWSLSVEARVAGTAPGLGPGLIATLSGNNRGKTRPFAVPKGHEYFVIKWTASCDEVSVEVNGIDPTSCFEYADGGRTGELLVYEAGRFFAEVDADGPWTLEIVTE